MNDSEEIVEKTEIFAQKEDKEARTSNRWLRRLGYLCFGFICFSVFLIAKLPQQRLQNFILAHLRIAAQNQGLLVNAERIHIDLLPLPHLVITNLSMKSAEDAKQELNIQQIKARPSYLSLLTSTKKFIFDLEGLGGEASGVFGISDEETVLKLQADEINLKQTSLLKQFLPVELSFTLNGTIDAVLKNKKGEPNKGDVDLKLSQVQMPAQNLYGFPLPQISIQNIDIKGEIQPNDQFVIQQFQIGKDFQKDDLVGKITGDVALEKMLARSKLNLKANFKIAPKITQALPLLDSLLSSAKMADGNYQYRIRGTISFPEALPGN